VLTKKNTHTQMDTTENSITSLRYCYTGDSDTDYTQDQLQHTVSE